LKKGAARFDKHFARMDANSLLQGVQLLPGLRIVRLEPECRRGEALLGNEVSLTKKLNKFLQRFNDKLAGTS